VAVDILMMIKKEGNPVAGESRSVANTKDSMTSDFKWGFYVDIDDFDFGISLVESDTSSSSVPPPPGSSHESKKERREGKYAQFVYRGQSSRVLYPPTFDEVSIKRQMDKSTPGLFAACFNTKPLDRVSVVKRKSAGAGSSTGNIPFLRVDFDEVLITDISLESGDVVKETLKFVYRSLTLSYRPQKSDGSPDNVITIGPLSLAKALA
jgi:type VI protein secretion system component Hcp